MKVPYECPNCKADLRGKELVPHVQKQYDGITHFSKAIAIYNLEFDEVTHWQCPKCNHQWEKLNENGENNDV